MRENYNGQTSNSWFRKEITVGTIIQVLTMLILAIGAYFKFDNRVARSEEQIHTLIERIDRHEIVMNELVKTEVKLTTIIEERNNNRKIP